MGEQYARSVIEVEGNKASCLLFPEEDLQQVSDSLSARLLFCHVFRSMCQDNSAHDDSVHYYSTTV